MGYKLLDSGYGKKLVAFVDVVLERPSPHALWRPSFPKLWDKIDLSFSREKGWKGEKRSWIATFADLAFHFAPTDFGHVGFFPEHQSLWSLCPFAKGQKVLNLFGYTGAFSIRAAKQGAFVTHVDASKPAVLWAKKNAAENHIDSIRWIVEDAMKFLKKEQRRGSLYDGIIMDPPSFGRGAKGEVFQIETDLLDLLDGVFSILKKNRSYLLVSCHTPGFTPLILEQMLGKNRKGGCKRIELFLGDSSQVQIPAGVGVFWQSPC